MQFGFPELIAHAAKTRPLAAGTLIGSGTVANYDESRGSSCVAERRVLEVSRSGGPRTPNGKIAELAVREAIHDRPIKNAEALANPEALEQFKGLPELQE